MPCRLDVEAEPKPAEANRREREHEHENDSGEDEHAGDRLPPTARAERVHERHGQKRDGPDLRDNRHREQRECQTRSCGYEREDTERHEHRRPEVVPVQEQRPERERSGCEDDCSADVVAVGKLDPDRSRKRGRNRGRSAQRHQQLEDEDVVGLRDQRRERKHGYRAGRILEIEVVIRNLSVHDALADVAVVDDVARPVVTQEAPRNDEAGENRPGHCGVRDPPAQTQRCQLRLAHGCKATPTTRHVRPDTIPRAMRSSLGRWVTAHPWRAHAVAAVLVFTIAFALVRVGPLARGQISDTWVYQRYGDAVVDGRVPYRDFNVEYPPAALAVFVPPSLPQPFDYARGFQVEMFVCGVAAVLAAVAALRGIGVSPRRARLPLAVVALSPLLVGTLILSRYDPFAAALTALAIAALTLCRDRQGAVALALAFAAKFYVAALLPLFALDVWRRRGRNAALRFAALSIAVAALIFVPFAVAAPTGISFPFARQLDRPLQAESLASSIYIAIHQLTGLHIRTYGSMGSENLAAPGVGAAETMSFVLTALLILLVCVAYAAGPATCARFCIASAAVVAGLVAFGKVLSPQYMLWLAQIGRAHV